MQDEGIPMATAEPGVTPAPPVAKAAPPPPPKKPEGPAGSFKVIARDADVEIKATFWNNGYLVVTQHVTGAISTVFVPKHA